jgi:hypothetical protein
MTAEFVQTLGYWALVALFAALVVWAGSRRLTSRISLAVALTGGCIAYLAIATAAYFAIVGKFTSLRIDSDVLYLAYPTPHKPTVSLPIRTIKEVLFGLQGKGAVTCYLVLETESGTKYQSAAFMATVDSCKTRHASLATALAIK